MAALGNPASTSSLVGIYTIDAMPSLNFQAGSILTGVVLSPASFIFLNSTVTTSSSSGSLSSSQITGGYITRSGPVANFTDTTDTGTNIVNAFNLLGGVPPGTSAYLLIKNTTNFTETIVGGAGVTISGGSVINANSEGSFVVQPQTSSSVTITLASVGNGQSSLPNTQFTSSSSASSSTVLTATQVSGANQTYLLMNGATSSSSLAVLPTAANLIAAFPNATVGSNWVFRILNASSSGFNWTLSSSAGSTITGSGTVSSSTWREYAATVTSTSTSAVSFQYVGSGTYS